MAETRQKCVVTMSLTQAEQPVAVRTKFGPRGPSWDLWGPQKGRYQAKVCGYHVTNRVGPIGGSWDQIWPPRLSEDLRGAQKGPLGAPGVPQRSIKGTKRMIWMTDVSPQGTLC